MAVVVSSPLSRSDSEAEGRRVRAQAKLGESLSLRSYILYIQHIVTCIFSIERLALPIINTITSAPNMDIDCDVHSIDCDKYDEYIEGP